MMTGKGVNSIPFKENANFYAYDEKKIYVCEMFSKYLKPKKVENKKTWQNYFIY